MALEVSISKTDTVGRYLKVKTGTITFDSSYPTGGESLSASDLGFSTKVETFVASPNGGLIFEYDFTNSKLEAYYPSGGSAYGGVYHPPVAVPAYASGCYGCAAAAGALIGGAAAAARGGSYATLPPDAIAITRLGVNYYISGNTWYQPVYGANGVFYRVVPAP